MPEENKKPPEAVQVPTPGQMSDEQVDQAIAWLKDKWGTRPCPYCHNEIWTICEDFVHAPIYTPTPTGSAYPMVQVICENCGHAVLVSAMLIGLLTSSGKGGEDDG